MALVKKKFGNNQNFLDWSFSERVVYLALQVPRGQVVTYGDIAKAAGGGAMAAQSITSILGKAYEAGERRIPFHRIVYANGRVWLDETHTKERLTKYKSEGILLDSRGKIENFAEKRYDFRAGKS
jgi:methylated-DNA-protein-cysteine methyltransferase related protein